MCVRVRMCVCGEGGQVGALCSQGDDDIQALAAAALTMHKAECLPVRHQASRALSHLTQQRHIAVSLRDCVSMPQHSTPQHITAHSQRPSMTRCVGDGSNGSNGPTGRKGAWEMRTSTLFTGSFLQTASHKQPITGGPQAHLPAGVGSGAG